MRARTKKLPAVVTRAKALRLRQTEPPKLCKDPRGCFVSGKHIAACPGCDLEWQRICIAMQLIEAANEPEC